MPINGSETRIDKLTPVGELAPHVTHGPMFCDCGSRIFLACPSPKRSEKIYRCANCKAVWVGRDWFELEIEYDAAGNVVATTLDRPFTGDQWNLAIDWSEVRERIWEPS